MYRSLDLPLLLRLLTKQKSLRMPPPLPDAQKNRVQLQLHNRVDVASIAKVEGVAKSSIYRIIDNLLTFGTHTAPPKAKKGRPSVMSPTVRDGLKAFIKDNPEAYQYEMQYDLFDRFGVVVSQSTISNTIYAMKISRKGSVADRRRSRLETAQIKANHRLETEQSKANHYPVSKTNVGEWQSQIKSLEA